MAANTASVVPTRSDLTKRGYRAKNGSQWVFGKFRKLQLWACPYYAKAHDQKAKEELEKLI
jgi:hypothetical protein